MGTSKLNMSQRWGGGKREKICEKLMGLMGHWACIPKLFTYNFMYKYSMGGGCPSVYSAHVLATPKQEPDHNCINRSEMHMAQN